MQHPISLEARTRLPAPVACLAISHLLSLVGLANAHALPLQTTTVDLRVLDVLPYPPQPTPTPHSPRTGRRRRQDAGEFNTICGYIGGDPELPATCSLGSHCVVDSHVGAIGCCPDFGLCTTGVFTGCVDVNSPPQTEINPYVYTCSGSDVCYMNRFDGGNFQYGCGSASDLAASVIPTASGQTGAPPILTVSAPMTQDPVSLSEPTIVGTVSKSRSSDPASSTRASSTRTSRSSTSSRPSPTPTKTSTARPSSTSISNPSESSEDTSETSGASATEDGGGNNQGAIIGGSVGGAVALIGLIAAALFFWKRRRAGNLREGPGPKGDTQYISPMSKGRTFTPVAPNPDMYEQAYVPGPHGTTTTILGGKAIADPGRHPAETGQPFGYGPSGEVIPTGRPGPGRRGPYDPHDDQVPLTQEYDDFSRGFNDALSRIEEEDSRPATAVNNNGMSGHGNGYGAGADNYDPDGAWAPRGGDGPLWQQNRRQSRNMMWMQQ